MVVTDAEPDRLAPLGPPARPHAAPTLTAGASGGRLSQKSSGTC